MSSTPQGNPDLHERVAEIIDSIRPYIQADGGDIDLVDVADDGTVKVRLRGACAGCPHAAVTLKMGVERALQQRVPEVREVVQVA
jgi:Fe-S cluster biogenesis protein NfuA